MFGSSLGDLALRRVWNHRTHNLRMSSTSLRRTPFSSLNVRRPAVSLPFQIRRLKVVVEAGLVAFSSMCFEFCGRSPKGSLAKQPCAPSEGFSSHLDGLSEVAAVGFCA